MSEIVQRDRIAIILATCNGQDWLSEQLASVKSQTHDNWHLFVRDDHSADNTQNTVNDVFRGTGRLSVLEAGRFRSGSAAANFFTALMQIDLSVFDYVCFADQDDIWAPGKLARAVSCLKDSGAAGYSCDLIAFDNERRRSWYLAKSGEPRHFDYLFQGASAGCTYVLTRDAARLVCDRLRGVPAGLNSRCSHDWLIYAICRSHGLVWHFDKTAHVFYRQHGANAFGAMPDAKGLLSRLRLARSGWYREQVTWLENVLALSQGEQQVLLRVKRNRFTDRLWLARRVAGFRRESRDRLLLAAVLLGGFF